MTCQQSGASYDLTADDTDTVLGALDVAAEYREYRAGLTCAACAAHPAEVCDDHLADLEAAGKYRALAGRIWETRREAGR